jgi:hypothetical protein
MFKKGINTSTTLSTSLMVTTGSGIFGGMIKVFSSGMLPGITLSKTIEVAYYAAISAIVGYGIKLTIDHINYRKNKLR